MNDKDQKYNKLIIAIKRTKLECSPTLTAEILSAVGKLPHKPKGNKPLRIVCWASSIAAMLFLGIFLSEHPAPVVSSNASFIQSYSPDVKTKMSLENGNTLDKINNIIREKREFRRVRNSFYTSIINNHSN